MLVPSTAAAAESSSRCEEPLVSEPLPEFPCLSENKCLIREKIPFPFMSSSFLIFMPLAMMTRSAAMVFVEVETLPSTTTLVPAVRSARDTVVDAFRKRVVEATLTVTVEVECSRPQGRVMVNEFELTEATTPGKPASGFIMP